MNGRSDSFRDAQITILVRGLAQILTGPTSRQNAEYLARSYIKIAGVRGAIEELERLCECVRRGGES